jgi:hypothetical protein
MGATEDGRRLALVPQAGNTEFSLYQIDPSMESKLLLHGSFGRDPDSGDEIKGPLVATQAGFLFLDIDTSFGRRIEAFEMKTGRRVGAIATPQSLEGAKWKPSPRTMDVARAHSFGIEFLRPIIVRGVKEQGDLVEPVRYESDDDFVTVEIDPSDNRKAYQVAIPMKLFGKDRRDFRISNIIAWPDRSRLLTALSDGRILMFRQRPIELMVSGIHNFGEEGNSVGQDYMARSQGDVSLVLSPDRRHFVSWSPWSPSIMLWQAGEKIRNVKSISESNIKNISFSLAGDSIFVTKTDGFVDVYTFDANDEREPVRSLRETRVQHAGKGLPVANDGGVCIVVDGQPEEVIDPSTGIFLSSYVLTTSAEEPAVADGDERLIVDVVEAR